MHAPVAVGPVRLFPSDQAPPHDRVEPNGLQLSIGNHFEDCLQVRAHARHSVVALNPPLRGSITDLHARGVPIHLEHGFFAGPSRVFHAFNMHGLVTLRDNPPKAPRQHADDELVQGSSEV